jgi:drug/metabolite transporter (DMT)-like permease
LHGPREPGIARPNMKHTTTTLVGFTAVLMWALLALFSAASGKVPPFQLAAMTFAIGTLVGVASWPFRSNAIQNLKQEGRVWLLGVAGLFGYHFVYFSAIRAAPAVEVSLIAYLWPLFLVAFSALLPGEKLKAHHIIGVVMGLMGAALVISRGNIAGISEQFGFGHVLAFACAFIWSVYSVLSRRFARVPTDVVVGYCFVTAILSALCHLLFENTVWPGTATEWLSVLGLGLFPVGLAFYTWDIGVKRGDIMVLGAASYAAPLLSTLVLLAFGMTAFHWSVAAACILITGGALIAAKDMLLQKKAT